MYGWVWRPNWENGRLQRCSYNWFDRLIVSGGFIVHSHDKWPRIQVLWMLQKHCSDGISSHGWKCLRCHYNRWCWLFLSSFKFFSVGAISIYLFDRYLKKKEVREHEKQVLEYNKFETNPMLATEQTSHTPYPTTSPDQTSRQTSGRLEATQHEPNTTQSNSFYMQDNQ